MVLVTGAAGKTGLAVIRALSAEKVSVRALVRRRQQEAVVKVAGAHESCTGDMTEPATLQRAARGVRAVYHICPNMSPDEVIMGQMTIAAAKGAGVSHFVYHSVLHPQVEAMPHHWHKMRVEEMLFASGLPATVLQPAAYMQNILTGWDRIVGEGIYQVPYSVQTRLSMVDLVDVAEAAALVLADSAHIGATYELVGRPDLNQAEIAALLSQNLGRRVRAEQIALAEWRQLAEQAGLPRVRVDMLVKMFGYYEQCGLRGGSWLLEQLLPRPVTDLPTFIARAAEARQPAE
jgi:NAD(P)H dehydrogenase (quinone)